MSQADRIKIMYYCTKQSRIYAFISIPSIFELCKSISLHHLHTATNSQVLNFYLKFLVTVMFMHKILFYIASLFVVYRFENFMHIQRDIS